MGKSVLDNHASADDAAFLNRLRVLLALSLLAVGLYYEWGCALASVCFGVLLFRRAKTQPLRFMRGWSSVAVVVLVVCYGLSVLWAVDRGLALWGLVRMLPVVGFALVLQQLSAQSRGVLLGDVPYLGAAMTVLTFALQWIPAFSGAFSIAGRLGGLFQYPNTFACFLLLGVTVLLIKPVPGRWDLPCCALLAAGLMLSRSRAVLLLAAVVLLLALVLRRDKKTFLRAAVFVGAGAVVLLGAALLSSRSAMASLRLTAGSATMYGRLLYWKDALRVICRHPFGLGYLGYYLTQGSFQTGVYSVRWVHNDALQLALDVGWTPTLLLIAAILRSVFSRRISAVQRAVLLVLCAHCMVDFDLSFGSMWFVLLLCLDWSGAEVAYPRALGRGLAAVGAALCALSVWIGAATAFSYAGSAETALRLYPWDTFSGAARLTEITDGTQMLQEAERILRRDRSLALVWDAKARGALSRGDVATMLEAKQQAIACARYSLEEYIDYFDLLTAAISLYDRAGDTVSAQRCLEELKALQPMLDALAEQTDPLAWRFPEQPELTMPEAYQAYLAAVGN